MPSAVMLATSYEKLVKIISKTDIDVKDEKQIIDLLLTLSLDDTTGHQLGLVLIELLGWLKEKNIISQNNIAFHGALIVAISKTLTSRNLGRFILNYLHDATLPLDAEAHVTPVHKKAKYSSSLPPFSILELMSAIYTILKCIDTKNLQNWDWSRILRLLNDTSEEVRWLACNSIGYLVHMNEEELNHFINKYVSRQLHNEYCIKYAKHSASTSLPGIHFSPSLQQCKFTAQFGLVHLPIFTGAKNATGCLISLSSTEENLEAVALAVSSCKPVLIEGVVGSGKTSLIEHLSSLTGRSKAPYLTKIQLGDQTDSKMLVGNYHCTPTPGEFIWKPGSLTKAVQDGYWLLLEDIDSAPMDVISLLIPLLESRTLPVPGHGNVKAHPDFQIFASRRILPTGQRMALGRAQIIERLWSRVVLKTLSPAELRELVSNKWPDLKEIASKLVEVYLILSSGQHEDEVSEKSNCTACTSKMFITSKTSGRLISVRDLIKWCSRIVSHLHKKDLDLRVFQEAFDCFCMAIPNLKTRFDTALHIGAHLNITDATVQYYCDQDIPKIISKGNSFSVGYRASLIRKASCSIPFLESKVLFSPTRLSSCLLERIAVATKNKEPVLLVGETGTGKTSTVQYLAQQTNSTLKVINLNQQSDSSDLLGGFKPVETKAIVTPLRNTFELLFSKTFTVKGNPEFLGHIMMLFANRKWKELFHTMDFTFEKAIVKLKNRLQNTRKSQKKMLHFKPKRDEQNLIDHWNTFKHDLKKVKEQTEAVQSSISFSFIEGTLVKALREGHWVLLDEINLASAETLECLSGLLEGPSGSIVLHEKGDNEPIARHPNFMLFACMNPATDVGKKELAAGLRNRFTELYVEEFLDKEDLKTLVFDYLKELNVSPNQVEGIVKFYLKVRKLAAKELTDGTGHKPYFSLRTLCRALSVAQKNLCKNILRSLYESFSLSFLTQLDRASYPLVTQLIKDQILLSGSKTKTLSKGMTTEVLSCPGDPKQFVKVGMYWVSKGDSHPLQEEKYIVTPTVKKNLEDLVRIVSLGNFPILLQGDTSVGKTSLISYLSKLTGNTCLRINNHQHTDIQEYLGSYAPDESGKLVFKEGLLVKAMRAGHWIILDELNLAPTEVLEALNRLLDDNRELFIPEIETTVKAHPRFRLFATQNPPGLYGGRQVLSRAFRNRFVELHFDLIPSAELETILHYRCDIPRSYCKKMIAVMEDLQNLRRESNIFQGKHSFITLRDLFRWGERYRLAPKQTTRFYDWDQHLADEGYILLAGRARVNSDAENVLKVLEKRFKKVDPSSLFNLDENTSAVTRQILKKLTTVKGFEHVVWTQDMRRLFVLSYKAMSFFEPVLLVGDTGCGKTTACQIIAALKEQEMFSVNCHMHTEGADFLGGLRPVRIRENSDDDRLFEWVDGPLILAMRGGGLLLLDEISLADDSVLERLNSILEPERTLVLAEKGSTNSDDPSKADVIVANQEFRLVGTMNPGGDYGKKELSPALRNRFTEIWCPKIELGVKKDERGIENVKKGDDNSSNDVKMIIEHNINKDVLDSAECASNIMLSFLQEFSENTVGRKCVISIRDILSWVSFINEMKKKTAVDVGLLFIEGACLVFLDSLGSGAIGNIEIEWEKFREFYIKFLRKQIYKITKKKPPSLTEKYPNILINNEKEFGIGPFVISKGTKKQSSQIHFSFEAKRTSINLVRILRGLQLNRPLLLEGSPGVGKTSLVVSLANATNNSIVRINLSEQTDVSDLFGADLPVEGAEGGRFAWRDGPLLQALKDGSWIVLDELNLASQSVLEGLNACFDHRGEIFVPELNTTFYVEHSQTKIFGCQNPQSEGGARKGLPKSFLNRFTQIHMQPFSATDLKFILSNMYREFPLDILSKMVQFNSLISQEFGTEKNLKEEPKEKKETKVKRIHRGGPWEFNLRDLFRWCDIMLKHQTPNAYNPGEFVGLIYSEKMRDEEDKEKVFELYLKAFTEEFPLYRNSGMLFASPKTLQIGHAIMDRCKANFKFEKDNGADLYLMREQMPILESIMHCINMNWMTILVGSSGKGKTTLLRLLSSLVGKKLEILSVNSHMDVTELLGGFEQADWSRQFNTVLENLEEIVLFEVRNLLIKGKNQCSSASDIHQQWRALLSKKNLELVLTPKEEAVYFIEMCDDAIALIERIEKFSSRDELENLLFICLNLKYLVETNGKVSGGGIFEWVESPLVKAIRDGHWLLIDGANLCSPSVLDRLNGLLEPGGVLTITERGVIDGSIPTLEPHPDFRLFLTCTSDSQFGEISRAMRNRGIEIFLTHSWKELLDLKTLMMSRNLHSDSLQQLLLKVHHSISESFPDHDLQTVVSVPALAHAAFLLQQFIDLGLPPDDAFKKAVDLGYLRNFPKKEKQKALEYTIQSCIEENSEAMKPNSQDKICHIMNSTLLTSSFLIYKSELSYPSQVASLLHSLFSTNLPTDWSHKLLLESTPLPSSSILPVLYILLPSVPFPQWNLVKQIMHQLYGNADKLLHHLDAVTKLNFPNFSHSYGYLSPADPRFNMLLLRNSDSSVSSASNKALVGLWEALTISLQKYGQSDKIVHKVEDMTLLQISEARFKGKIGEDSLYHRCITYIFPLLKLFSGFLNSLSSERSILLKDGDLHWLREALLWRDKFTELCSCVVKKESFHLFMPKLVFHWRELQSNLFKKIPNDWMHLLPSKIIESLDACFSAYCSQIHDIIPDLSKRLGFPAPFRTEELACMYISVIKLSSEFIPKLTNATLNLFLASDEGSEAKSILIRVYFELLKENLCFDSNDAQSLVDLDKLKGDIGNLKSAVDKICISEAKSSSANTFCVQLWPFKDYLIQRQLVSLNSVEKEGILLREFNYALCQSSHCPLACIKDSSGKISIHSTYHFSLSSSATNHPSIWLNYSSEIHSNESPDTSFNEQSEILENVLLNPSSCLLTYQLLVGLNQSQSDVTNIPVSVHSEKIQQLKLMQATLFENWGALSTSINSFQSYLTSSTASMAHTLLTSLSILLGVEVSEKDNVSQIARELLGVKSLSKASPILNGIIEHSPSLEEENWEFSQISFLALNVGILQTWVLSHMHIFDPALERTLKMKYCLEEENLLHSLLKSFHFVDFLRYVRSNDQPHPHIAHYNQRVDSVKSKIQDLSKNVAYRPPSSQYGQIKKDLDHFMKTSFAPNKILDVASLVKKKENFDLNYQHCIVTLKSWDKFIIKMIDSYPLYRDIISPLLDGISLACTSLRTILEISKREYLDNSMNCSIEGLLSNLLSFPSSWNPHSPLERLDSCLHFEKELITLDSNFEDGNQNSLVSTSILRMFAYDLYNITLSNGTLTPSYYPKVEHFCENVMVWWLEIEEERKKKEEEKESLYKYKSRTLAASELQDEEIEREYHEWFPSYEGEFDDMEKSLPASTEVNQTINNNKENKVQLTEEHFFDLVKLHLCLMTNHVKTDWYSPPPIKEKTKIFTPLLIRGQLAQKIMQKYGPIASELLDGDSIGTFIMLNQITLKSLKKDFNLSLQDRPYNFYQDSFLEEAIKVKPLLNSLENHVNELFDKISNPSHATLLRIKEVIHRVLNFSVTSPLIRFIIGLETTLQISQEWESIACREYSLSNELTAISNQVLTWRKMELKAWKSCLEMVSHKVMTEAYKWWPHLYNSLSNISEVAELIKLLKQFMEGSLLGDFKVRCQYLITFQNHLNLKVSSSIGDKLCELEIMSSVIWNLYCYYSHFIPSIELSLLESKKPVEKEVKEFVKVSQWNDINFFSVKESVHKSRRTLHLHMRQWEKILRQPAASFFMDKHKDLSEPTLNGTTPCVIPLQPVLDKSFPQSFDFDDFEADSLFARAPKLYSKGTKFIETIFNNLPYATYCEAISEMTNELVSSFKEMSLATARLDNIDDKEEKTSQAKSLIHRKREGLSSLFKALAQNGISYTKGNALWRDDSFDKWLNIPPIGVSASDKVQLNALNSMWDECTSNFHKTISRLAKLSLSLEQPHKDLSPEVIKRLKGITRHAFLLTLQIKEIIPEMCSTSLELQRIVSELSAAGECFFSSTRDPLDFWTKIKSHLVSLQLVTQETDEILASYGTDEPVFNIFTSCESLSSQCVTESRVLLESILNNILKIIESINPHLKNDIGLLFSGKNLHLLTDAFSDVNKLSEDLITFINLLEPYFPGSSSPYKPMKEWLKSWKETFLDFNKVKDSFSPSSFAPCCHDMLDKCLKSSLFGIENLYKKYMNVTESSNELPESMISDKLVNSLLSDIKDLNLSNVVKTLSNLIFCLKDCNNHNLVASLGVLIPFCSSYMELCDHMKYLLISSFKHFGKLLCILLGVFDELATKGFCRPQDVDTSDEDGQGQMTFEDSGVGLTEGQGKKDISDRFESEDQLESALQQGQQEQEANEDLVEEEGGIEMSEDFQGKMQDVKDHRDEENDKSDDEEEQEEFDKQMGETEKGSDKIDEKLWGDEEEEEKEKNDESESRNDEEGPGMDKEESQVVANEDNKSKEEREGKEKKELNVMEEDRREPVEEQEESTYDDNFKDNVAGEKEEDPQVEDMDFELPEELNLDKGENDADENEDDDVIPEIEEKDLFPEEDNNKDEKGEEENDKQFDDLNDENKVDSDNHNMDVDKEENSMGNQEENIKNSIEEEDNADNQEEEMNVDDVVLPSKETEAADEAQPAHLDSSEASKDKTKDKDDSKVGAQKEDEEEEQQEQGEIGEKTEDQRGTGHSDSKTKEDAHEGKTSSLSHVDEEKSNKENQPNHPRRPGDVNQSKTLGDDKQKAEQGLMTKKAQREKDSNENTEDGDCDPNTEEQVSDLYEHINKANQQYDKQLVDAATQEQSRKVPAPLQGTDEEDNQDEQDMNPVNDVLMESDEEEANEATPPRKRQAEGVSDEPNEKRLKGLQDSQQEQDENKIVTEGDFIPEMTVERPQENSIFTLDCEDDDADSAIFDEDFAETRENIAEAGVGDRDLGKKQYDEIERKVEPLANQLCEMLRLILEPTEASKLKGDFRTGKRLNMKKVIAYIASQYRKDKIWLRRTQPNKRSYQVIIAVDDSDSMEEVNASNLAREGVLLVAKALTKLETGQIGVISFGTQTQILHPLNAPLLDNSGPHILANLNFDQKQSNFSRMLEDSVALLAGARGGSAARPDIAQLLLILSDGQTHARSAAVKAAVRAAREAKVFIVFLVLDAHSDQSFCDYLVYEDGKMKSILEVFPFPYFLVVKDIASLPDALSTALRQWFELVTSDAN